MAQVIEETGALSDTDSVMEDDMTPRITECSVRIERLPSVENLLPNGEIIRRLSGILIFYFYFR